MIPTPPTVSVTPDPKACQVGGASAVARNCFMADAARWELEAPLCAHIRRRVSISESFGSNPIVGHLFTAAHRYRAHVGPPVGT